jgi:hypothetical protein
MDLRPVIPMNASIVKIDVHETDESVITRGNDTVRNVKKCLE